jgi:hypothetical protein
MQHPAFTTTRFDLIRVVLLHAWGPGGHLVPPSPPGSYYRLASSKGGPFSFTTANIHPIV